VNQNGSDTLLAQAGVDRVTVGAHMMVVDGPSYRERGRATGNQMVDTPNSGQPS
jgi:hypothetical protein